MFPPSVSNTDSYVYTDLQEEIRVLCDIATQLRVNRARMKGARGHTRTCQPLAELSGKHYVCEFAPVVRLELSISEDYNKAQVIKKKKNEITIANFCNIKMNVKK